MVRFTSHWPWPIVFGLVGCNVFANLGEERIVVGAQAGAGGDDVAAGGGGAGITSSSSTSTGGMWAGAPECAPESDLEWLRTFGDFSFDEPGMIVPDGDGGYFLQGRFDGTIDLGAGPITSAGSNDFYLARLDGEGQALWTHRYGTTGYDELGPWLAPHPDGFVICGTNRTLLDFGGGPHTSNNLDAYIALMSPQGDLIWEQWLEGPAEQRCWGGVAVDPTSGDVYAGVLFKGEMTVGGQAFVGEAEGDAMVLRLAEADGSVEAARHWGDVGQDHIRRLVALADGTVVVSAYTEGSVDLGQGTLPDGPGSDPVLARFHPDLTPMWTHVFPSSGNMAGVGLIATEAGDLIWSLVVDGTFDIGSGPVTGAAGSSAIARVAASTGLATEVTVLDGFDAPFWLAEAADGAILVAGNYAYGISVGGVTKQSGGGGNNRSDGVLLKMGANLQTVEWVQFAGESDDNDGFGGLALGDDGSVVVTGYFHDQLDIEGCSSRASAGESDAMLMKRKP